MRLQANELTFVLSVKPEFDLLVQCTVRDYYRMGIVEGLWVYYLLVPELLI